MTLSEQELRLLDAYWRAANYLSVGQIYLLDNPLLREPLRPEHVKPRLLGHFGTTPGLNLHLRAPEPRDPCARPERDLRHRAGPRRAGPRRERVPRGHLQRDLPDVGAGRGRAARLFRQFSFPGGIPSHVAPETPGSIHEGGELGYALAHAFGAAFDNPDLLVACVVGDGEAETGPLATSWHANKFLNARTDGAVLPILHLNGYKIANPTVLARIPEDELARAARGLRLAAAARRRGDEPATRAPGARGGARRRARRDRARSSAARERGVTARPRWPMIVLRTPKGWTGPEGGRRPAGRGHVALAPGAVTGRAREPGAPAACSRSGCAATAPRSSSTRTAGSCRSSRSSPPRGERRMSANPHANGGVLLRDLVAARLPRLRRRGRASPATTSSEATRVLGGFLRDVIARNRDELPPLRPGRDRVEPPRRRVRGRPTARGTPRSLPTDEHLAPDGRVMEVLSRAPLPGLARGLPADRQARPLQLLRGVHPHRRLDVQPAREVAEGDARHPVAAADRVAQLPAQLARLAAGPQRLLAPGSRASSTTS